MAFIAFALGGLIGMVVMAALAAAPEPDNTKRAYERGYAVGLADGQAIRRLERGA